MPASPEHERVFARDRRSIVNEAGTRRGADVQPRLAVLSSLFPSAEEPLSGLFIRERMFRVSERLPVTVVAPVPWFPLQGVIRDLRPHFRLTKSVDSVDRGIRILRPRYLSVPGPILLDGVGMAAGAGPAVSQLVGTGGRWIIDAHFAYPDGYAASLLARRLGVPFTVTLRGTEVRHSRMPAIRRRMATALQAADRVFAVSESLRQVALGLGADPARAIVISNGVDTDRFHAVPRQEARRNLGLPADATVLLTVGGLVRRKGFHRVIERMQRLRQQRGNVIYLIVGGASREGDDGDALRAQAKSAGVADAVRFLGPRAPDELAMPLSAADVFVLPSANEGWANVLLESMACGTPVVASDVGGNREVVADPETGLIFALGDERAFDAALGTALDRQWDRDAIIAYARRNSWRLRVDQLVAEFMSIAGRMAPQGAAAARFHR